MVPGDSWALTIPLKVKFVYVVLLNKVGVILV